MKKKKKKHLRQLFVVCVCFDLFAKQTFKTIVDSNAIRRGATRSVVFFLFFFCHPMTNNDTKPVSRQEPLENSYLPSLMDKTN